ncbi:MAG TPA: aldose epimerase family protein [Pirellulales bacterium]|nr:aldose epimerase family protein [Pirellulales bacterium]
MIDAKSWGKWRDGQEVQLYTLTNPNGMVVTLTNYGGHVVSVEVPDREGNVKNVVLGFDNLDSYIKHTAHFGATIGRYGNRIAKGKFTLDGQTYTLPINNGPNHLHGGPEGFDHQLWQGKGVKSADAIGVEFTYVSKDGEQGYPGTLTATATYWLTKDNELKIDYAATTDKDTVVNLTNHAYWNLAGAGSGDILGQQMMIAADKYLAVDDTLIPTGKMEDVKGSMMDFTSLKPIGPGVAEIKKQGGRGYDHCYVLRNQDGKMALAAKAKDPASGRVMEVRTDQPGIQFYTGNFLDGDPINGGFPQHAAFCLETQHYPDSPNRPEFPSTELKPGETFKSTTIYKFTTE